MKRSVFVHIWSHNEPELQEKVDTWATMTKSHRERKPELQSVCIQSLPVSGLN